MSFLRELKHSYKHMEDIFTKGSCFRLCVILQTLYPSAIFLYSEVDGHWITEIDEHLYDINGEIDPDWAKSMGYKENRDSEASAYVPTYEGNGVYYGKYLDTI